MTQSYKQGTRLDASAQQLLESLNDLVLREARHAAARRTGDDKHVSSLDILGGLKEQQKRGRWQARAAFATQVIVTALTLSGAVISLATVYLAVNSVNKGNSGALSPIRPLLVTVLLAMLLTIATAILLAILRDFKEHSSRTIKPWKTGSSPRRDQAALLSEWSNFEKFMRRELYTNPDEAPADSLSDDIIHFSELYELDPGEIRSVLRVRNSVAHDSRISAVNVRKSLQKLRSLRQKLDPPLTGGESSGETHHD